jgi:glycosyltransferase involved in cell wall biosynthesis
MVNQLRIGIDGYNLALRHGTGIATYGRALARTLKSAGHRIEGVFGLDVGKDPALREVLFFDMLDRVEPAKTRRQFVARRARLLRDALKPFLSLRSLEVPVTGRVETTAFADRLPPFDRLTSAAHLFAIAHLHFRHYGRFVPLRMDDPPDIMHWTYPLPIELVGSRNIYTLHDLVPLRLPYTTLDAKASYRALTKACMERGAHICTVSEASRRDIVAEFGIDPARVTNSYQASPLPPAALAHSPAEDAAMIEGIFGLPPQGYFLFFGAIEPKKNLGRLIEGYLSLQTETPLVIVGARAWRSDEELRLLREDEGGESAHRQALARRIIRLDYMPRPLLLRLIRGARALVFPSLYEGFGLPVLEAMQLGTPILTSNTSALPEVAGEAAVLVDPYDPLAIASGLRALDSDPALRARLSQAGPEQAARFSEAHYRTRLDEIYARVMAHPVSRA